MLNVDDWVSFFFRIILYAIAMADHDQDNLEDHEKLMSTKQGLESLSLYSSSIGRYVKDICQIYYAILAFFLAFGNERNGGKCLMLTMIKP